MLVRKARKHDIESMNELSFEMHRRLAKSAGVALSEQELESEEISPAELKKENYYVAVIDGRPVGFVAFSKKRLEDEWCGSYVYLYEIALAKRVQGRGVGRRLFQAVFDHAKRNRLNIRVGTIIKNKQAIRFYRKLGFKPFRIDLLLDINKKMKPQPR